MDMLLITLIAVLSVFTCALTAFWFIRAAKSRDDAKPQTIPRRAVAHYRWDGKTNHSRDLY
jgi:hypothetical protein